MTTASRQARSLTIALLVALPLLLLFLIITLVAANASTRPIVREDAQEVARRVISPSVRFGIDSPLWLGADGQSVTVTGHGDCGEGGAGQIIRVWVTQAGAQATGQTTWGCANPHWSVSATAPAARALTPGPAEVCAQVVVHHERAGAEVARWCREVTLE